MAKFGRSERRRAIMPEMSPEVSRDAAPESEARPVRIEKSDLRIAIALGAGYFLLLAAHDRANHRKFLKQPTAVFFRGKFLSDLRIPIFFSPFRSLNVALCAGHHFNRTRITGFCVRAPCNESVLLKNGALRPGMFSRRLVHPLRKRKARFHIRHPNEFLAVNLARDPFSIFGIGKCDNAIFKIV